MKYCLLFRFSLRSCLIVVTAIAVACGYYYSVVQRQKRAVLAIQSRGGNVYYAAGLNEEPFLADNPYAPPSDDGFFVSADGFCAFGSEDDDVAANSPEPSWYSELLGDDFLFGVDTVTLRNCRDTDSALTFAARFSALRSLDLHRSDVSDAGLAVVSELTNLEKLNLMGARITDAGLNRLSNLAELAVLDVTGTQATSNGISALQKALPNCRIRRQQPVPQVLDEAIVCRFEETPLDIVVDYLNEYAQAWIVVDDSAHSESDDLLVTVHVSGVPLEDVLADVLRPLDLEYRINTDTDTIIVLRR